MSAIIHQQSLKGTTALFKRVFAALEPGGRILVRDLVMDASRTRPPMGALFAVNMLVATEGGGTYTFREIAGALRAAGFAAARGAVGAEASESSGERKRDRGFYAGSSVGFMRRFAGVRSSGFPRGPASPPQRSHRSRLCALSCAAQTFS